MAERMIGRQAGKPFSAHFYKARWNKPQGESNAAKNGEVPKPLVPSQFSVLPFEFRKQGGRIHSLKSVVLCGQRSASVILDQGTMNGISIHSQVLSITEWIPLCFEWQGKLLDSATTPAICATPRVPGVEPKHQTSTGAPRPHQSRKQTWLLLKSSNSFVISR